MQKTSVRYTEKHFMFQFIRVFDLFEIYSLTGRIQVGKIRTGQNFHTAKLLVTIKISLQMFDRRLIRNYYDQFDSRS